MKDVKFTNTLGEILDIKSSNNMTFYFRVVEYIEGCNYQILSEKEDKSINSLWKEEYNESGWGEMDAENEEYFNSNKKVYSGTLLRNHIFVVESDSFLDSIKKAISKELIENKPFVTSDDGEKIPNKWAWEKETEFDDCYGGSIMSFVEDTMMQIKCNDYKIIKEYEYESDDKGNKVSWYSFYEVEGKKSSLGYKHL